MVKDTLLFGITDQKPHSRNPLVWDKEVQQMPTYFQVWGFLPAALYKYYACVNFL